MEQSLRHVALVVRDYDEAIEFYTRKLHFTVVEDTCQPDQDKRWVVVAPPGSSGTSLLLARASKPDQESFIGHQSGGRVFLFLGTDDFSRDYAAMVAQGIEFVRPPKEETYGTVAVFKDLYGNLWDLVQLAGDPPDESPANRRNGLVKVSLRPITAGNMREAASLHVKDDQKHFVAANIYSIAQAQFYSSWQPHAVHADEDMVGFVMWGLDEDKSEPEWWIVRLMIEATHQKKGYGKAATLASIDSLKAKGANDVFLSFEPSNAYARAFYEHLGFVDTGRVEDGEVVFCLHIG